MAQNNDHSKEEILDWKYTHQTEGITALICKTFPSETRDIALNAMEQYASLWQQKYNDLKARYDQMDAETTKASTYAADAYERLFKAHDELKGKAGKLVDALKVIAKPIEHGDASLALYIRQEIAQRALQGWEKPSKHQLARTVVAVAEEVSKDADTARAYLESEGVDVKKIEAEGKFFNWLAKLYAVTAEKTGQRAKINHEEARKWYDSGATPEQCFRENWQSDGD